MTARANLLLMDTNTLVNSSSTGIYPELLYNLQKPTQVYRDNSTGIFPYASEANLILGMKSITVEKYRNTDLSVNRIAAECGLSKGNLHYHFRTKQAIVLAIYDRIADEIRTDWVDDLALVGSRAGAVTR